MIVLSSVIGKGAKDVASTQQQLQTDNDIDVAIQTATDDFLGITSPKQLEKYLMEKKVMVLEQRKREWKQVGHRWSILVVCVGKETIHISLGCRQNKFCVYISCPSGKTTYQPNRTGHRCALSEHCNQIVGQWKAYYAEDRRRSGSGRSNPLRSTLRNRTYLREHWWCCVWKWHHFGGQQRNTNQNHCKWQSMNSITSI